MVIEILTLTLHSAVSLRALAGVIVPVPSASSTVHAGIGGALFVDC